MSSLVYLGYSIILFLITYGIGFLLIPMVLGPFFSAAPTITDPTWAATNTHTQNVIKWIIPLAPAIGVFIFVIKVLMVASIKGRD